jgi:hypothetical protein
MTIDKRTYDPRCYELAEVFLTEHVNSPKYKELAHELAYEIQSAIEDWLLMFPESTHAR